MRRFFEGTTGSPVLAIGTGYPDPSMRLVLVLALFASLQAQTSVSPTPQTASRSVTVALAQEPDRFYAPATQEGQLVANLVFDPLVGLDDQMNPYPALAAMVPSPDNGLVRDRK